MSGASALSMWQRVILPALKKSFPGKKSFVVQQDGDKGQNDAMARRLAAWGQLCTTLNGCLRFAPFCS